MTELLERIQTLIASETRDLDQLERTLTDGYAHALSLEAEQWRLDKRIAEVASGLQRGDPLEKARELANLSERRQANDVDLAALRGILGTLRRHAAGVRVAG